MKRTRFRILLATALAAGWLCVIWGNSLLPGTDSSRVSGRVAQLLQALLPFLDMESGNAILILRKCAHFSEFAVLGVLLAWLMGMLGKRPLWPAALGIAVAAVDETIQLFVPGRCGCVTDVCIDTAGVLTGVAVLMIVYRLKKTRCG